MTDTLFLDADSLNVLVSFVVDYVAWGVALAFCFWAIGYVLAFARDFLMGGV